MTGEPPAGKRTTRHRASEARARAVELERQAAERFERERSRRTWVQLGWSAWHRDARHGGGLLAGGLAYRVFLWQLPAALFFVCLFGVVTDLAGKEPAEVVRSSGISAAVATTVAQAAATAGSTRWWLLVLGAWGMLWAGRGAAGAGVLVSRIAWGLPRPKVAKSKASLAFTGFMIVGIAVQTAVPALLDGAFLEDVVVWTAVTVAYAAWAGFAMSLLGTRGTWTAVAPGAALFGVGSRLLGLGSSLYFASKLDRIDDLYGTLGVSIVIMLFLYIAARLFVWGLFLNATIAGAPDLVPSDAPATGPGS